VFSPLAAVLFFSLTGLKDFFFRQGKECEGAAAAQRSSKEWR